MIDTRSDEVQTLVRGLREHGHHNNFDPDDTTGNILRDFFLDHDDPRYMIVDKDLQLRGAHNGDFYKNLYAPYSNFELIHKNHMFPLADMSSVEVTERHPTYGDRRFPYQVSLEGRHFPGVYIANFSHNELKHLMAGLEYKDEDHEGKLAASARRFRHRILDSDFETEPEEPSQKRRRYAAYRAPAGGVVIRGTFYPGGKMVPDMTGEFVAPKRRRFRSKVKKMPAGAMSMDGTTAPIPETKTKKPRRGRVKKYSMIDAINGEGSNILRNPGGEDKYDPHNFPDAVFRDYLLDHDDPRHMIVTKDLEARKENTPGLQRGIGTFFHNLNSEIAAHHLKSSHAGVLADGTNLGVTHYQPHAEGNDVYQVNWNSWDFKPPTGIEYMANLSHDELKHLLSHMQFKDEKSPKVMRLRSLVSGGKE